MRERRILIVYGTTHGQAAKVARRIAERLRAGGDEVTLVDCDEVPAGLRVRDHDGVVVGGSVQIGGQKRSLRRFVRAHRDALNALPSAFYSVSGSAASSREAERAAARRILDAFPKATGWTPDLTVSLAGEIAYTRYHPILRWWMRRLMVKEGGPTDTSRDHEFTDWSQVERFADAFSAIVPRPSGRPVLAL